ncbi:MAG: alpha/beta hydrolase [Desulfobacteraceae bacterium]|jgi:acetyl esterase|nr:alpha/beta hydrolase [Desulfobacteraceae bacterium]
MVRRKAGRALKIVLLVLLALGVGGFWLVGSWSATPYGRLDPRVAVFLKLAEFRGGRASEADLPIAELRQRLAKKAAAVAGKPAAMAEVRDLVAQSGDLRVPVRVYAPEAGKLLPVVIFYHGGGWVQGSLDTHDGVCRAIARKSGSLVVSADYRLAPEHPFPAAVDDAYGVLVWVHANGSLLQADASRIAVAGDSAGGNLAAAVCLMARDRKGPAIALQVLIYPALDAANLDTPSYGMFGQGYGLDRVNVDRYIAIYLPEPKDRTSPRASPLLADDLADLPPALVITAGFDVLRDEGEAYARKLQAAGTAARVIRYPGMIHGFVNADRLLPQARRATDEMAEAIRGIFAGEIAWK